MPLYRIHPSIGVARVGDSDDYYLAPERAGSLPINPDGRPFGRSDFRDSAGRLRRQGSHFRVFRYESDAPDAPCRAVRLGTEGVARIEWTVHVANKKPTWYEFKVNAGESGYASGHPVRNADVGDPAGRVRLMIDPGPRTVARPGDVARFSRDENPHRYPMTFPPEGLEPKGIDTLGELRRDDEGALVVLGGHGCSGTDRLPPTIVDYANNDRWWDDTSDGPVTARLVMDDGSAVEVDAGAWVLTAPPRFAPQILNIVTLYDTMLDVAIRNFQLRPAIFHDGLWNRSYRPNWETEILPLLARVELYRWVAAIPSAHHIDLAKLGDPDPTFHSLRDFYMTLVRPPEAPNLHSSSHTGSPLMPMLCGDNCFEPGPLTSKYLTVTETQYFLLQQWASDKFDPTAGPSADPGAAFDRGSLENCVGGAFSPGIEMTWISRDPRIYSEPFRIKAKHDVTPPLSLGEDFGAGLEPGDLCRYMALPWQADFNECSQEQIGERYAYWWPAQRPDFVYVERGQQLVQVPWVGTAQDQTAPDYIEFADDIDMVRLWSELGFVYDFGTAESPRFLEVDRKLPRS